MAHSATFTTNPLRFVTGALVSVLKGIGNTLIRMAEAGPKMREVKRLNEQSDADLAAKGLTREGEVRRIFSAHFYS